MNNAKKTNTFSTFLKKKRAKNVIEVAFGLFITVLSFLLFFITDFHPVVAVLIAVTDLVVTYLKLCFVFKLKDAVWWKKVILLPLGMVFYYVLVTLLLVHLDIFAKTGTWMHLLPAIFLMPCVEVFLFIFTHLTFT